ncbi:terpene synthase family protein [Streptomyces sp. URMC 124]|uniref:terpene synthase family protein n=1 Tax=Streptomyces sp. URMC 124 TaxID=3423405 RepID=UPI003F1DBC96
MTASGLVMPFPHRISADLERARAHGLAWARRTGLVNGPKAIAYWKACAWPEQACLYWPYARGEAADLATDTITFYFFFDDQFDAELGRHPGEVLRIQKELAAITRTDGVTDSSAPVMVAFADIWRRLVRGMSPIWRERAGRHWRQYFHGQIGEAVERERGTLHTMETYLAVRRYTVGAETSTDSIERFGGFEVPEEVSGCPQLRVLRQLSSDILMHSNDLHSFHKETAHGEVNNLICITAREEGLETEEAIERVRRNGNAMIERFCTMEERDVPQILAVLGPEYHETVPAWIDALKAGMYGYDTWGNTTSRYLGDLRPERALGHLEDLTSDRG